MARAAATAKADPPAPRPAVADALAATATAEAPPAAGVHAPALASSRRSGLSPRQKAAAIVIALGSDTSASVLRHLSDPEIELIMREVANMDLIPGEIQEQVLGEFSQLAMAQDFLIQGGVEYARDTLERALGTQKAADLLHRLTASMQLRPFAFAHKADPAQLINFIQSEHPQTIALVLAHLSPEQSATLLSALPTDLRPEVARRIAQMESAPPEIIREVERALERRMSTMVFTEATRADGITLLVEVLNRVDRGTEKGILESLAERHPSLADEIKRRLFVFEDLVLLDNRSLQRVLRDVDLSRDLPLALKVASEDLKAKIFKNLSERAGQNVQDDMGFLGPVRMRDVEEAQQKIVAVVRRLEEAGEIVVARGGGAEIVI